MKRANCCFAFLLLAAFLLNSCSMLTAQGRRERAYASYVRKCSKGRVKQQSHFSGWRSKIPKLTPSEPVVSTDVDGPASVTTADAGM